MIATILCRYALVSVSESVSVKFSALYLVSKVSEKSGIGPPLENNDSYVLFVHIAITLPNYSPKSIPCYVYVKRFEKKDFIVFSFMKSIKDLT